MIERATIAALAVAFVVLGFVSAVVPAVDVAVSAAVLAFVCLAAAVLVVLAGAGLVEGVASWRAARWFAAHRRYVAGLRARGTADDPDPTTPFPRALPHLTADTAAPAGREQTADTDTRKAA